MKDKFSIIFAVAVLLMKAIPAQAHTDIGMTTGYLNGFVHPLLGMDHVLTMLGIGLWGRILGGRLCFLLPAAFVIMMACGVVVNFAGFYVGLAETGIAASMMILGLLLCLDRRLKTGWALALVILSAVGQGYVHADEIDKGSDAIFYMAGFLSSTTLLLGLGAAVGCLSSSGLNRTQKAFGWLCAFLGVTLLSGI
ncbi:MAG: HupE/UreJ family protein [Gammaproteobacteria bacterium]